MYRQGNVRIFSLVKYGLQLSVIKKVREAGYTTDYGVDPTDNRQRSGNNKYVYGNYIRMHKRTVRLRLRLAFEKTSLSETRVQILPNDLCWTNRTEKRLRLLHRVTFLPPAGFIMIAGKQKPGL